nr:hypothetical protein [Tanacetum cinerariifolium]
MDGMRETWVISPTDLPILVLSSPGIPLRATLTQYALLVDVDTKESVVELQTFTRMTFVGDEDLISGCFCDSSFLYPQSSYHFKELRCSAQCLT